jgi:hypothetical protein
MEKIDKHPTEQPLCFSNALEGASQFPLIQAIAGRRSRRFCLGAEIPEGPLAFKSNQKPFPLTELEQMLLLTSMAGSTGWHYAISYDVSTRPNFHLSVLDLLEEPFPLLLALRYQIFSLQMITGHITSLHVISIHHLRIIEVTRSIRKPSCRT